VLLLSYCEDSLANEVEHIYPKSLFPDKVFDFDNYLYACGRCNAPKNNQFSIRIANQTQLNLVEFKKNNPNTPPPIGTPLLVNPRIENGMDFLRLDLQNTFEFTVIPEQDSIRADYTKELLRLNSQPLTEARIEAYHDYSARVNKYFSCKLRGDEVDKLKQIKDNFLKKNHPSVWFEIKRYFKKGWLVKFDAEFAELLMLLPEILEW
jgi:hypothetical protein